MIIGSTLRTRTSLAQFLLALVTRWRGPGDLIAYRCHGRM